MKNILITGANGYLGSHLIEQLAKEQDFSINAFDLDKKSMQEKFAHIQNIRFFDTEDWEYGNLPFSITDIVVHCAFARAHIGIDLAKSLVFTQGIFTKAVENNCNIINISSRSVYGQNKLIPWEEQTQVEPDTLYALAKYNTELLLEGIVNANKNIKYTNLRLAGLISPSFDDRIINKFVMKVLIKERIKIVGGKQLFAYLDIRDAASGIIAILNLDPNNWKKTYNLGSNKTYTLKEIGEKVIQAAKRIDIQCDNIIFEDSDLTLFDGMDCSTFYSDTNWQPKHDIDNTIESIFEYKLNNMKNS